MSELVLRHPAPDDAEAVLAAVQESMRELEPWMPWCHPAYSLTDAQGWISSQPQARAAGSAFEFVITRDARVLGGCGINAINRDHRLANLGYWVRASETGRGVATEAARLLANWSFATTDLERLEIVVAVGNRASQAVADKAGAAREGVLRSRLLIHGRFHDAVMYSLVRPSRPTT